MIHTIIFFLLLGALVGAFLLVPKQKKTKIFGIAILSFALLFEIFVVNFHSFHLWFGGYEKQEWGLNDYYVSTTGMDQESGKLVQTSDSAQILLRNVGQKVGTIRIKAEFPDNESGNRNPGYVTVRVDAKDETQAYSFRQNLASGEIISGEVRTEYIPLDLSGNVSELRIILTKPETEWTVEYTGITLNEGIPMRFSAVRLALFVIVAYVLYAIFTFESLKAPYEDREKQFLRIAISMTVIFVVLSVALSVMECGLPDFRMEYGNQMTRELVDAFEHGQVSLLDEPNEKLLGLNNPYDWSERSMAGVSYKWDHLLFEGKYYSYYGIAPVVLLFLPYHLITGYYFPSNFAILLFGVVGIVFLTLLFLEFVKRYGKRISVGVLCCSLFIMQMSSGVFYNFMRGNFYEIAQSAGFMFVCMGFYFLLRSGVASEEKTRLVPLCLSSVCLALAVLSRPTLALYCVCAVLFILIGFFKMRSQSRESGEKMKAGAVVAFFAAALVPYLVLGGAQAIYNYARFGSFLDFGIQYSLTINDFTRSQYHTDFVMIGLFNFLVAFPIVRPTFPFIFSNFSKLNTNGYYYVANTNAVGLFWRSLPMFGYFGAYKAWKLCTKEEKRKLLMTVLPVCIISPLVIIFSIWESGYGVRYCADFAWELILGGCLFIYLIYARGTDETGKSFIRNFFAIAAVAAFIVNGAMLYDYIQADGELALSLRAFERLFNFWF